MAQTAAELRERVTDRGFELDRFQIEAIEAFDAGDSVLVAAPTGAGKTVIAEHALGAALDRGEHAFYTSPIKALANQKFRDFCDRFGEDRVGLLTGDITIRGHAPIVVMTTEVLRNMLYEHSPRLRRLGCVVLDEVHYLADRQRGPVWEEVLLNLPGHVATVSLSATVSNLDEFVDWLRGVRGDTTLVVERNRPVPLEHLLAVGERERSGTELVPLLSGTKLSANARRYLPRRDSRGGQRAGRGGKGRGGHRGSRRERRGARTPRTPWRTPRRSDLVRALVTDDLGPLIWFIFSRAGCDEALEQCRQARLSFTDDSERDRLLDILDECTADIDDDDWYRLDLDEWQVAFESGIASHHAGLIPAVKEAVEIAFAEGLIQVVFATETLALGVNLPARTVVIEKFIKFNGEDHQPLTPMEFTQLTGRAGRRGLDRAGTAVSCWSHRFPLDDLAKLAASTDYPLRSAFTPNYNMVANLIRRSDREAARRFVARSFAQFQTDRSVIHSQGDAIKTERRLERARADLVCERGDVRLALRGTGPDDATAGDEELGRLRPGSVLGERGGMVVLSVAHRNGGVVVEAQPREGDSFVIRAGELSSPLKPVARLDLPVGASPTSEPTRDWARHVLRSDWAELSMPVESCPEFARHRRALLEVERLEARLAKQRGRAERRAGALERRFDAVAALLHDEGFAHDWSLSAKGDVLAAVHGDSEIVLAEALHQGRFDMLDAAEFAAVVSVLCYQSRQRDGGRGFTWPTKRVKAVARDLVQASNRFRNLELVALNTTLTGEPDAGFVEAVYGWATGQPLEAILPDDMTGGDFVRAIRLVIDLCRQIAQAAEEPARSTAAEAVLCLDHGLVRSRRDLLSVVVAPAEAGAEVADDAGNLEGDPSGLTEGAEEGADDAD